MLQCRSGIQCDAPARSMTISNISRLKQKRSSPMEHCFPSLLEISFRHPETHVVWAVAHPLEISTLNREPQIVLTQRYLMSQHYYPLDFDFRSW